MGLCLAAVDMWSVGCIFGEVIRGTVLFPGTDRILASLLEQIINTILHTARRNGVVKNQIGFNG
jgi:hypothetical protein